MIVERSTPARAAASIVEYSPHNKPIQISNFCHGDRNRFERRPPVTALRTSRLGGHQRPHTGDAKSLADAA